ncbi:MAG: MFS transporter [Candidatus Methanofastidiosa archaeon]|nr:MFS transporter [Candidatus Methanofastidiosa archaeon]
MVRGRDIEYISFLRHHRNVLLLCIAIFMSMIGFGMIFPLLPTLASTMGASKTEVGIIATSFAVTRTMLVRPFGALSDRIGRKPMLIYGFLGYGVFMSSFALAHDIYTLMFLRAMQGICSACVWPAASALIADSVTARERGRAMGYLGMSTSVGLMFGPAFGGILKDLYGVQIPFLICGIITGSMPLLIKMSIDETVLDAKPLGRKISSFSGRSIFGWIIDDYREIKNHTLSRTLFSIFIAGFIFNFAYALIEPLLPIFVTEKIGASATEVGLAFTAAGLVGSIVRPIAGDLADKIGRKTPIVIGSLYSGIMTLPLIYIRSSADMIGIMGVRAVGWAMSDPATLALLSDVSDERKRGKLFGLYQLSSGLGWMLGPITGGIIYDLRGAELSFIITAVGTLLTAIILFKNLEETLEVRRKNV